MSKKLIVSCTVQDKAKQQRLVKYDMGPTLIGWLVRKSDLLSELLTTYSDGQVSRLGDVFSDPVAIDETKFATAPYMFVDQKAVVTLRDSEGGHHKIEIPCPKASMFENVPEKGWRVTQAVGLNIATKLTDMGGYELTFVVGKLKSKDGKND